MKTKNHALTYCIMDDELILLTSGNIQKCPHADPEEILRQQQAMKVEMQGGEGRRDEYSTYDEDVAHLQSRFQHVDVRFDTLPCETYLVLIEG